MDDQLSPELDDFTESLAEEILGTFVFLICIVIHFS